MKLYNTLTRKTDEFRPLHDNEVSIYSCGPTVYDHIHIGNLSSFIAADTLHRTLQAAGYKVSHVMNFTDVDDKTIRRSTERYPDLAPEEALKKLTEEYSMIFLEDMEAIGNDTGSVLFVKATDNIENIRELIRQLYKQGFAYKSDDGVYFSIEKYKKSGKIYGQLLKINSENTSAARIDNDEYDKESVHDFALWKVHREGEPAWEFELDGHDLTGRPGWHVECSAMSTKNLGQPFDIHTGGVDLIFPHHENEIAQSTAGKETDYAKLFVHNEHLLVDGKKMSKSLNNFFTLRDIQEKGYEPLAFRLMVLQAHYRSQSNFTWENLDAAQNRLKDLYQLADLQHQAEDTNTLGDDYFTNLQREILAAISDDINTPEVLRIISEAASHIQTYGQGVSFVNLAAFKDWLVFIDNLLGLDLSARTDITDKQKNLFQQRQASRETKDWKKSDELRDQLADQGIGIRDTENGQIWYRL